MPRVKRIPDLKKRMDAVCQALEPPVKFTVELPADAYRQIKALAGEPVEKVAAALLLDYLAQNGQPDE